MSISPASLEEAFSSNVIAKCPFLHGLAKSHGEGFARSIATNPVVTAPSVSVPLQRRDTLQEFSDAARTFELFHGPEGVVPLPTALRTNNAVPTFAPVRRCPFAHSGIGNSGDVAPWEQPTSTPNTPRCPTNSAGVTEAPFRNASLGSHLPLASLSLGGGFPFSDHFHNFFRQKQPGDGHVPKPKPHVQQPQSRLNNTPNASASSSTTPHHTAPNSFSPMSGTPQSGTACPLRKWLGPLAGVVFDKQGHISCPEPIIQARAFVAALPPVRGLRPQAMHIKFAAIGVTTALLNVPCGMWREHTEKFGLSWFVAVHATIPFIAMLRKAVIMPKYAIIFTIAAAVAGQQMGAKLERQRLTAGTSVVKAPSGLRLAQIAPFAPTLPPAWHPEMHAAHHTPMLARATASATSPSAAVSAALSSEQTQLSLATSSSLPGQAGSTALPSGCVTFGRVTILLPAGMALPLPTPLGALRQSSQRRQQVSEALCTGPAGAAVGGGSPPAHTGAAGLPPPQHLLWRLPEQTRRARGRRAQRGAALPGPCHVVPMQAHGSVPLLQVAPGLAAALSVR